MPRDTEWNRPLYEEPYIPDAWSDHDEEDNSPPPPLGDLSNAVHPIFASHNFPAVDYQKLTPALRLATLLIDTDCLLTLWHAIFFGRLAKVYHGDDLEDYHEVYFPEYKDLSAAQLARVRLKLRTLGNIISFHRGGTMEGYDGITNPSEGRLDKTSCWVSKHLPCYRTEIQYSERTYEELLAAECDNVETRLRAHFNFAVLLIHELAHAAWFMEKGDCSKYPLEDCCIAEDGYQWEASIFGGPVRVGRDIHDRGIHTISEWPSPHLAAYYKAEGFPVWTLKDEFQDVEARWFIPLQYLGRLFSASFWEKTVPKQGPKALKVPRMTGLLYRRFTDGDERVFEGFDPESSSYKLPDDAVYMGRGEIDGTAPGSEWEWLSKILCQLQWEELPEESPNWAAG